MAFAKIGKLEHLQQFQSGQLYMNSLNFFSSKENHEKQFHDKNEGIRAHFQPNSGIKLVLGEGDNAITLTEKNFAGPITIRNHFPEPTLCLMNLWSKSMAESCSSYQEAIEKIKIPSQMLGFGDYVLIITNPEEFVKRCNASAARSNYNIRMGIVEYIDLKETHRDLPSEKIGFIKDDSYRHEREWRMMIMENFETPFLFKIGDLSDISTIIKVEEFNLNIKIAPT